MRKMNLDLSGVVFSDEQHTDVGAAAFELDHDWFTQEDLVIRTAPAGGGTLLVEGVDYQLSEESADDATKGVTGLSTRTGKHVYHEAQIINATYQTGDLYFSGKYIADSIDAADARPGHLWGLTLSNNVTDPTNDIDIAAGEAADNADGMLMVLASALTKRLDAAWTVGSGNGGLDTGAIADTTYHVWLIERTDTGVVDALFSASATSPTMPAGYNKKRRIGSIIRAAGAILLFDQRDDCFSLRALVNNRAFATLANTNRTLLTLTVPPSTTAVIEVIGYGEVGDGSSWWVRQTAFTDVAASITNRTGAANSARVPQEMRVEADGSSQIAYRGSSTSIYLQVETAGWIDTRGRLA